ncbi:MAG TPA: CBS domain-containing protein [Acidimicrobiales bacterium]|nr:CBS domain-containing protein [Acidimicrobiales bacterium]
MARPFVPSRSALRARYERRSGRLTMLRQVREALISLAGLVGRPVTNQAGAEIGTVVDAVARWDADTGRYPPLTGLVARVGRRRAWLPIEQVDTIDHGGVRLRSAQLDLRDFARREGEVELFHEVVDHQLVDTDGARVVRASDLYVANVAGTWRLVGVDVGFNSILRRLGPAAWRTRPTPEKVIDWASIHRLGGGDGELTATRALRASEEGLRRLHPGELADLLEDLGRSERQALLADLPPEQAADALEEMQRDELAQLLREADQAEAVDLLSHMEPDEAADALRELEDRERDELLAAMPAGPEARVRPLLDYDEDRAGGMMTSLLVRVSTGDTVKQVRRRLRNERSHEEDLAGVVVVDASGALVDDVTMTELFLAQSEQRIEELIGPPWPVTVGPDADIEEVARRLVEARSSSVLVVDEDGRPQGRILADDVVDALIGDRGRFRFPRRLT